MEVTFVFKVALMEFERGWGNKVEEVKSFDTYESAVAYIESINSKNTLDEAPDLYWKAEPMNFSLNP